MARSSSRERGTTRSSTGRASTCWPTRPCERADIRVVARFADPIAGRDRRDLPPDLEADDASDGDAGPGYGSADDRGGGPTDTMVFTIPRPSAPAARLRVAAARRRRSYSCEFDGSSLTIGRAADNDLVLADGRVSRHHAPHHRPARDARLHRSREHQRFARQRRPGRRAGPGGRRPDRAGRHGPRRRGDRRRLT